MTSHNATRNAHDVMWKWIGWQHQRRTCYRVQCHNVAWWSIYECLSELSSTTNILHFHLVHNKNISHPTILELYVPLACFDKDMFRSKYARRFRPWTFSMHCRWRHWGRGIHFLPLQRRTREISLSTWLPIPGLYDHAFGTINRVNPLFSWRVKSTKERFVVPSWLLTRDRHCERMCCMIITQQVSITSVDYIF